MKDVMMGTYIKGDESFNFTFKTNLTAFEKAKFVSAVTDVLVRDNYLSVLRDVIFDFYIINMFTDADVEYINSSSESIDEAERFLKETNIMDIIRANARDGLIDELNKAVDDNIEYNTRIHRNPLGDAFASLSSTLEKKVNELDMGGIMDIAKSFSGVAGDFTPENIVNAYLESDIAKQNAKELEEKKKEKVEIANEMAKVIDITDKK